MKYINVPVFIVSVMLGLIFVYLSAVPTETVIVYPTPENAGKVEYRDKAGTCFAYRSVKVKCPRTGMKVITIQE